MAAKIVHQFSESILEGDATSDQVFLLRDWLREWGFESHIYAENCAESLRDEVRPFMTYRRKRGEMCGIYHHAIGSNVAEQLLQDAVPLLLVYHNVTPPDFFRYTDPVTTRSLVRGREQLAELRDITLLGLGASDYSALELKQVGFDPTGVLPIVLDEAAYDFASDEALYRLFPPEEANLLFVGRVAPNKCQDDLIKLLYYFKRVRPGARLHLIGSLNLKNYVTSLQRLAENLNLGPEAVQFHGHVSQGEMVTAFRAADLFVSMSEHEGFGKPLIESMYFDLPILAHAAAAVPSTLGGSGILFHEKDYEALAELIDLVLDNQQLRRQIITGQQARVRDFLAPQVKRQFLGYLTQLGLIPSHL